MAYVERNRKQDWRFASLQAFIGNHSPMKAKNKRYRAEDFMATPIKEQSPEQHQSVLMAIARKLKK